MSQRAQFFRRIAVPPIVVVLTIACTIGASGCSTTYICVSQPIESTREDTISFEQLKDHLQGKWVHVNSQGKIIRGEVLDVAKDSMHVRVDSGSVASFRMADISEVTYNDRIRGMVQTGLGIPLAITLAMLPRTSEEYRGIALGVGLVSIFPSAILGTVIGHRKHYVIRVHGGSTSGLPARRLEVQIK